MAKSRFSFFNTKKSKIEPSVNEPTPPLIDPGAPVIHNTGYYTDASSSDFFNMGAGSMSAAGVAVSEQSAMSLSPVFASVSLIGGSIASMPFNFFQVDQKGDRKKIYIPLTDLLNKQPAPAITAAVFWEYLIQSLLLKGDAYAKIIRPNRYSAEIIGFEPLSPDSVTVRRVDKGLAYDIKAGRVIETLDQSDVIHIPGVGFNGLNGMSVIKYALKNAAGTAQAAEDYSGAYFRNGAKSDLAIVVPGATTAEQVALMKANFAASRRLNQSFEPVVLSGGASLQEITLTAEDSQLLQTRKFSVEEIARIFGVPPYMIGHTEKSSSWGTGVEQMGIGFVKYTLQRILIKFEQEITRKCIFSPFVFGEFNTAGLERGDIKTRSDSYRIGLGRAGEPGWLTVNEVRKWENLPPVTGGDTLVQTTTGPTA